ncbi:MAG: protein phosphatase 2C domain-containing protein [Aliiglaciecola sp.]|uniref:PP2C family protein-serine/threonine phosphatase n=1 Tax=Aliiglaciecola sp. TaxID=1872441 RepID=UPI00329A7E84
MSKTSMYMAAGNSHKGMRRATNQDAIFMDDKIGIWIVADGMGGHNAGEVASDIVCKYLPTELKTPYQTVTQGIYNVHKQIQTASRQHALYAGMGCTIIMAIQQQQKLHIYWSGDCRAYVLCDAGLRLLSKDHSLVQNLKDSNLIDEHAAAKHPQRHLVTSCLGGRLPQPIIDNLTITLGTDDLLLLCSDGLYNELSLQDMQAIIKNTKDLNASVNKLIKQANEQGGKDNISAVLIAKN